MTLVVSLGRKLSLGLSLLISKRSVVVAYR
jgi:hypothetical protein